MVLSDRCVRAGLCSLLVTVGATFAAEAYAPGSGTGLSAVLMGPANSGGYGISPYDQFSYREVTTAYPNINVDKVVKTKTMFPSGTNFTKWVAMWRGKLIVPEDGTYRIYFRKEENSDALRFAFNGQTVYSQAAASAKDTIVTNTLNLTAGTYPIEVDWDPNRPSTLYYHSLVMSWDNDQSITTPEVIPVSQLLPVDDEKTLPDYRSSALDGYTYNFAAFSNGYAYPWIKRLGVNSYEVSGTKQSNLTAWTPILGKEVTGPFCAETTVDIEKDCDGYIALRFPGNTNADKATRNTLIFFYHWNNNSRENPRYSLWYSKGNADANVTGWQSSITGVVSPARLRVTRDGNGRITFSIRGKGQDWRTVGIWQSGGVGKDGHPVWPTPSASSYYEFETADRAFVGFGSQQVSNLGGSQTATSRIRDPYIGTGVAPTNVVIALNDVLARTVRIDFDGASGAQQVQYRLAGASEWTNYGEPLAEGVTNCVLTGLAYPNHYELRVVSAGDTLGGSESSLTTFAIGYGLTASLEGPYGAKFGNALTEQGRVREVQNFSVPFANLNADGHIFSTTNIQTALVCWRGKLVVPVAGTYTLRMEADKSKAPRASLRLAVDGQVLHDEFGATLTEISSGSNNGYVTHDVPLMAGEHPIEIDWLTMSPSATYFKLLWSRAANAEAEDPGFAMVQIPSDNFRPAAVEDLPVHGYDGFTLNPPGTSPMGSGPLPTIAKVGEGAYAMTDVSTDTGITYKQSQFTKRMDGRFTAEGTFYLDEVASQAGLVCRGCMTPDDNSESVGKNWISLLCDKTPATGPRILFTGSMKPDDINVYNASGYAKVTPNDGNFDAVKFRIRRQADNTLRFSYAYRAADTKEWSPMTFWKEYLDGTNYVGSTRICGGVFTNEAMSVGFISSTQAQSVVRDLKVVGPQGLLIIVR